MKKVLLATALSLCVTSAFAADPSAVLKVKGTLTNAACTPVLSNGGTVDYGTINLGSLNASAVNQLGQKNIDLTINCTAATKVSWNMVDDRADTNAGLTVENGMFGGGIIKGASQTYGVGKTAGGVNIGSYALLVKVDSVTADGAAVDQSISRTRRVPGPNPPTVLLRAAIFVTSPLRLQVLWIRWPSRPRPSRWQLHWLFRTPQLWRLRTILSLTVS